MGDLLTNSFVSAIGGALNSLLGLKSRDDDSDDQAVQYVEDRRGNRYTMECVQGRNGRTYWYFQGPVAYPFGHGLSYTRFAYSNLRVDKASADANDRRPARLTFQSDQAERLLCSRMDKQIGRPVIAGELGWVGAIRDPLNVSRFRVEPA